jgi:hypothetical protein
MNDKKFSSAGIIFTIVVTAGFLWAAVQWFTLWSKTQPITAQDMRSNEQSAFLNLQTISQAQKKYKEKDWNGDGKKTYADYFIHLWTSVSTAGDPVFVGLIPKRLGFALESSRAIDGYYFVDMHDKQLPGNAGLQRLDYENQWAVLAVPTSNGMTGMLFLSADQSGHIFVNPAKFVSPQYPDNLLSAGWIEIDTIQQLKDFQKKIIYPQTITQK